MPRRLKTKDLGPALSANENAIDHVKDFEVQIPSDLVEEWKDYKPLGMDVAERTPLFRILRGDNWRDEERRDGLRRIYKSFFEGQVLGAVREGSLPRPRAAVFSGGLAVHAGVAELVREAFLDEGVEALPGYVDGVHCGIARLAYKNDEVTCEGFQVAQ
jgi:hypothetical protein